jgi:hypothetical protein
MNNILPLAIGYLASALLALSLLVNNDLKFRWLNLFGCLSFMIYGALISALPIILTNTLLLFINLAYLFKIYRRKEDFDLVEFEANDKIIEKFLAYYAKDIHDYFPEFHLNEKESAIRFMVLRDMVIANIFIATVEGKEEGLVQINYTVPKYRDYKIGRFIFEKENTFLLSKGINQLVYKKVYNKNHEEFLRVMGFEKRIAGHETGYMKRL